MSNNCSRPNYITSAGGVAITQQSATGRGTKRKLADGVEGGEPPLPVGDVKRLVDLLASGSRVPVDKVDRQALRRHAHQLAEFCKQDQKDGMIDMIVGQGAIEVVVPMLNLADKCTPEQQNISFEDVEKEACFILGLLAVKPEWQAQIAAAGALPSLVKLLKQHRITSMTKSQPGSGGVARRAADAITNLAHENVEIKNAMRQEGGIPPLVALLEAWDIKVQRASAGALRTLAFKNEDNKNMIVECGALPTLIQMMRSEDAGVHYEAVGVIGNLVHSSSNIKRKVLEEGAMQPVVNLLSSTCSESQREAALLLGQFATTEPEFKSKIVQRGAVPPLIKMLGAADPALREMAAFALGRLAQNPDNQAGIVQCAGLRPLLELLESKHFNLQHNAAFALYGLSDNEDNVPDIVREDGLRRLMECSEQLQVQQSKDCVQKTITRIESKLALPRVLAHVVYMLRSGDKGVQQRVAMALARLAPTHTLKSIFVERAGLDVLLDVLTDPTVSPDTQKEASAALLELATKVNATAPISSAPQQPAKTVYLGEEYVNNKTLADVTFVVEGRHFHAHRIALLASSDAFRAMFDSGYREREAACIDIPNIPYDVFGAMMHYIYTGQVEVAPELARDLLQAADQYLLEGLKRLCEATIAQSLSTTNLADVYSLSEAFSAPQLGKRCVLFALERVHELLEQPPSAHGEGGQVAYAAIMARMAPLLKESLVEDLVKQPESAPAEEVVQQLVPGEALQQ